jgi:5-amino-6-(5-phosphoribosylamino)uracil reductase
MHQGQQPRPLVTVILAMSLDGKIADAARSPARFGSPVDKSHLETQIATVDAVLFGAGTLRAYGTTLRITSPERLQQRALQQKPAQPLQILCSGTGKIDSRLPFFNQSVPRWLLTTATGALPWLNHSGFEQILIAEASLGEIDWVTALEQLFKVGIHRVAVLGGGELVASLLAANLIDDLWLTLCPLLLGGRNAPTPVEGFGFSEALAPRLELLTVQSQGNEVFLHYRIRHSAQCPPANAQIPT